MQKSNVCDLICYLSGLSQTTNKSISAFCRLTKNIIGPSLNLCPIFKPPLWQGLNTHPRQMSHGNKDKKMLAAHTIFILYSRENQMVALAGALRFPRCRLGSGPQPPGRLPGRRGLWMVRAWEPGWALHWWLLLHLVLLAPTTEKFTGHFIKKKKKPIKFDIFSNNLTTCIKLLACHNIFLHNWNIHNSPKYL
jgi:hypothetical protein